MSQYFKISLMSWSGDIFRGRIIIPHCKLNLPILGQDGWGWGISSRQSFGSGLNQLRTRFTTFPKSPRLAEWMSICHAFQWRKFKSMLDAALGRSTSRRVWVLTLDSNSFWVKRLAMKKLEWISRSGPTRTDTEILINEVRQPFPS